MPLAFVNVLVCVDHTTFSLGHASHPVTVIAIAILIEESASTVFLILKPIAGVFSSKLATFVPPVGSLAVALVSLPQAFILVSILVELNAKAVLLVILPVADVPGGMLPLFALDASILLSLLLLYPVDRSVSAVLLCLIVRPNTLKCSNSYSFHK